VVLFGGYGEGGIYAVSYDRMLAVVVGDWKVVPVGRTETVIKTYTLYVGACSLPLLAC
jgi:hypothetical protein